MKTVTNNTELNSAFQAFILMISLFLLHISIEIETEEWEAPEQVYILSKKGGEIIDELNGDEPKPVDVEEFTKKVNSYISELEIYLSENILPERLKTSFEELKNGFKHCLDSFYI